MVVVVNIIDDEGDLAGTNFADIVQEYTAVCLMYTDHVNHIRIV